VHDFVGLHRVGLADAHEDEVVEDAFGPVCVRTRTGRRQREVHDLGEVHLEDGQEEFHGRAADVEIFHRQDADLPAGRQAMVAGYTASLRCVMAVTWKTGYGSGKVF
jgi:hypothetical protein